MAGRGGTPITITTTPVPSARYTAPTQQPLTDYNVNDPMGTGIGTAIMNSGQPIIARPISVVPVAPVGSIQYPDLPTENQEIQFVQNYTYNTQLSNSNGYAPTESQRNQNITDYINTTLINDPAASGAYNTQLSNLNSYAPTEAQQNQNLADYTNTTFTDAAPGAYNIENLNDAGGRRVRLRPKYAALDRIYGTANSTNLLSPLRSRNGIVWPYQPDIQMSQEVHYTNIEMIHANQDFLSYKNTPSPKFTVTGEFTVQSQDDGLYALACIHFLRTVTKMYFGSNDSNAGTPPPILLFDAYGAYMFNNLPVIITTFSVSLPKDVNYIPINVLNLNPNSTTSYDWSNISNDYFGTTPTTDIAWLPTFFTLTVGLTVQNSPSKLRSFNLDNFRSGSLIKQGGWI
jgi:hypothetical protein